MKKSIKAQAIKTTPWFTEGESVEIRFNVYDKPTRIWGKTQIPPVIAETGSLDHSTDYWIVFSDGRELSFNSVFGHLPLSNFFKKVA